MAHLQASCQHLLVLLTQQTLQYMVRIFSGNVSIKAMFRENLCNTLKMQK
jgi:hypothetical protein